MAESKGFMVFFDRAVVIGMLSDEAAGRVFKAMLQYAEKRTKPEFADSAENMAFAVMRPGIDYSLEKYENICRQNAENGRKGGRPPKTEEKTDRFFEKPKKPKRKRKTEKEIKTETDTETNTNKKTETENVSVFASPKDAKTARGRYENIFLSDEEYASLTEEYGREYVDGIIEEMSEYCSSTGKSYKNYSSSVRSWIRRRRGELPRHKRSSDQSYDIDDWIRYAVNALE